MLVQDLYDACVALQPRAVKVTVLFARATVIRAEVHRTPVLTREDALPECPVADERETRGRKVACGARIRRRRQAELQRCANKTRITCRQRFPGRVIRDPIPADLAALAQLLESLE